MSGVVSGFTSQIHQVQGRQGDGCLGLPNARVTQVAQQALSPRGQVHGLGNPLAADHSFLVFTPCDDEHPTAEYGRIALVPVDASTDEHDRIVLVPGDGARPGQQPQLPGVAPIPPPPPPVVHTPTPPPPVHTPTPPPAVPGPIGEIRFGTQKGSSFRHYHNVEERDDNQRFSDVKARYEELYLEVEKACGDQGKILKGLNFAVNGSHVVVELEDSTTGVSETETITAEELRRRLACARPSPTSFRARQNDVDQQFGQFIFALRALTRQAGISTLSPYCPEGKACIGSAIGKPAMKLRYYNSVLHAKQVGGISQAAQQGTESKQSGTCPPLGFIGKMRSDQQKPAVDGVLKAEAVVVGLRAKVGKKIKKLNEEIRGETDATEKQRLQNMRDRYQTLLNRLQADTHDQGEINYYGLYVASYYDDANQCYDDLLRGFFEEHYANVEESQRPSFDSFKRSTDFHSRQLRQYAADVAGTLLTNPAEWQLFYANEELLGPGIDPPKWHLNIFLNQIIKGKDPSYDDLGINFTPEEESSLREMVGKVQRKANGEINTAIGNLTSDNANNRLREALGNPDLQSQLGLSSPPGLLTRVKNIFSRSG